MVFGVVLVVVLAQCGCHISATNWSRVMKIGTHLPNDILHKYFFQNFEFPFFWFFWPFLIFRIPNLSFEPIKFFGRHISATYCPRVMKFHSHLPFGILHNYFFRNFEFPFFFGVFWPFLDFSPVKFAVSLRKQF